MPLVTWSAQYVTGEASVDRQHQGLFDMVNELHDAVLAGKGMDVVAPTLEKLASYTAKHFVNEERHMLAVRYPGYAEHKRKHDELAAKAREIITGYQGGQLVLAYTLSQFLGDWIRYHIKDEDQRMIAWCREQRCRTGT